MNQNTTDAHKLASLIKDIKFTMMSTVSEDGHVHSRPMATLKLDVKTFNGTLWFFSKKKSPKNYSIQNDQQVNLAYAEPSKQTYISVCGRAYISEDKEKMTEFWNPLFKAWFPEGLEDPEISLISVEVDSAEIWQSPPSKVVQLVGFVKAAVTGQPLSPKSGNQIIEIQHKH